MVEAAGTGGRDRPARGRRAEGEGRVRAVGEGWRVALGDAGTDGCRAPHHHRLFEPHGHIPPAEYEELYYSSQNAPVEPLTLKSNSLR